MTSQRTFRRKVSKKTSEMLNEICSLEEDHMEIEYLVGETDNVSLYNDSQPSNSDDGSLDVDFDVNEVEDNLYVSDSEDDEVVENRSLRKDLADWAVQNNITGVALDSLLKILPNYIPNCDLPKSNKTLLKTPTVYDTKEIGGGSYYHFGLRKKIEHFASQGLVKEEGCIQLIVGFDGLPISRSSRRNFWPILAKSIQIANDKPFMIGLYFSETSKPTSVFEYLEDFVEEYNILRTSGMLINGKLVSIKVICVVADAPARNFIKYTVGFNGYFGCDRCDQRGIHLGRVVFSERNSELRNDELFANGHYKGHQTGVSPLVSCNIGLVSEVVLDYMHLICLGVVRKLLYHWKKGPLQHRISRGLLDQISSRLVKLKHSLPSQFNRKPRSLNELEHWKATEFRTFLLYTGPVVLKGIIDKPNYDHFMLLSLATRIILSDNSQWYEYARSLFNSFVAKASELYSNEFIVYNVHSLVHIVDDAVKFGPLDRVSAFSFENSMQGIKKALRTNSRPLAQIIRRSQEIEFNSLNYSNPISSRMQPVLSSKQGENCYLCRNGCIVLLTSINDDNNICGRKFKKKRSFYTFPCDSSKFGVFVVSELSEFVVEMNQNDIKQKMVYLPYSELEGCYVCVPLIS